MGFGELLFVVGLPGSGKSPYLERLEKSGWIKFDDYNARAFGDDPHFCAAQRYCELLAGLRSGQNCVIADMSFCRADAREQALRILAKAVPGLTPRWRYFRNDPARCAENIRGGTRSPDSRLAKVEEFAEHYTIPGDAEVLEVWSSEDQKSGPNRERGATEQGMQD